MEQSLIDQQIQKMRELLGVENELVMAYEKKLTRDNEIKKLESFSADKGTVSDSIVVGTEAGVKRLEALTEQWQKAAKGISAAWVQGAQDMESAFKEGFFDVMALEFDNLQDTALGVLKSIQKMLTEILYQIARAKLMESISSFSWSGSGGGGGAVDTRQHGGWITEPIIGTGLRTGKTYTLGEVEPEYVIPQSKMGRGGKSYNVGERQPEYVPPQAQMGGTQGAGGSSLTINVPVNMSGEGDSTGLELKLRTGIEETVRDIVREEMR
jgi:hypothetical protein